MVIDKILYGIGAGSLAIIVTSKGEETAEEIGRITDRGVTSLEGMGTYTKSKRNVLLCACSKSEAYLVKNAVYQVDDSAFVMFTETSEVLGDFFSFFLLSWKRKKRGERMNPTIASLANLTFRCFVSSFLLVLLLLLVPFRCDKQVHYCAIHSFRPTCDF